MSRDTCKQCGDKAVAAFGCLCGKADCKNPVAHYCAAHAIAKTMQTAMLAPAFFKLSSRDGGRDESDLSVNVAFILQALEDLLNAKEERAIETIAACSQILLRGSLDRRERAAKDEVDRVVAMAALEAREKAEPADR